MSDEASKTETCQVDFYLLGATSSEANNIACRLALMAWERQQEIFVVTTSKNQEEQLNSLMWQYPEGRFLPHALASDEHAGKTPVKIGSFSSLKATDVVINLCPESVPQPERFCRILEIVPFATSERHASRVKYKTYRNLGLKPMTHEINT